MTEPTPAALAESERAKLDGVVRARIRVAHALYRAGYTQIEHVNAETDATLRRIRNIGYGAMQYIRTCPDDLSAKLHSLHTEYNAHREYRMLHTTNEWQDKILPILEYRIAGETIKDIGDRFQLSQGGVRYLLTKGERLLRQRHRTRMLDDETRGREEYLVRALKEQLGW